MSKIRDHNKVCNFVFSRSSSNTSQGAVIGMSTNLLLLLFLLLTVFVQCVQKNGGGLSLWIDSQQVKIFSGMCLKILKEFLIILETKIIF